MRAEVILDTTTTNPARIYDVWLGGKDNFAVDRDAAARVAPFVVTGARANRVFLRRAVTVTATAGIDHFLDLGAGLPGPSNVHEVARSINPEVRVVYLDTMRWAPLHRGNGSRPRTVWGSTGRAL